MKFKKFASAALAAAMLTSSVSIVAYAEEDAAMKKALTYVKQRVNIPEELSEFSYTRRESSGRATYYFTWETDSTKTLEWKSLSIAICGNVITSYRNNDTNSWKWGEYSFGKLSKEEILKKAEEQVKKLNPTIFKYMELSAEGVNISLASASATVPVRRVRNGVPVSGQTGSVVLNKDTGELMSYNFNWLFGAGFADPSKAVSVETAQEGYKSEFPVSTVYIANYNWETNEYTTGLIYKRDKLGQIDAFTGKLATFEDSYGYYENGDDYDDDMADEAEMEAPAATGAASEPDVSFTEKEKEKLELESKLIKPEQQLQALKDAKIYNLLDTSEVTYSNTYYNAREDAYFGSFGFKSEDNNYYSLDGDPEYIVSVPVDDDDDVIEDDDGSGRPAYTPVYYGYCQYNAETGEVLSYNASSPSDNKDLKDEKTAKKRLETLLKKAAGDKAGDFKTDSIGYSYYNDYADDPVTGEKVITAEHLYGASVYSPRYVYGIPCRAESVNISINGAGRISNYSLNYLGLEYPEPKNIVSTDDVYKKYFEQIDYSLLFRCAWHKDKVETALVYSAGRELYIDAFTGKLTDWNGNEIIDESDSGYTDLEGSKYRQIAEKLALYGITLMDENGRLNENMPVSRSDFSKLIGYIGSYSSFEDGEKALTRQYAAKMLTSRKLSSDIAEIPGLFNCKYSDVTDVKYIAYVALADALGLMSGKDGKFRPNEKITRGEALKMIYDFLS